MLIRFSPMSDREILCFTMAKKYFGNVFDLDFSRKIFEITTSLAFIAGFKRATDEGSLPEIAQYSPYYLPLNVLLLPKDSFFFIISSIGVYLVPYSQRTFTQHQ